MDGVNMVRMNGWTGSVLIALYTSEVLEYESL